MKDIRNAAPGSAAQDDPTPNESPRLNQGTLPDGVAALDPPAVQPAPRAPLGDPPSPAPSVSSGAPLATPFSPDPPLDGHGGEGGTPARVGSNGEFIAEAFGSVPKGASVALCSKPGDPESGGWHAMAAERVDE